jgi:predicted DNA-binding protein with PD1-like motif
MESASLAVAKVHILRIDPGEDVLASVKAFLATSGLKQAVVLGAYGTLAEHHVHWVKNNRIPAEDIHGTGEGGIEILSMNGLVVDGDPHIHVALSTPAGAYGGHLEEGCIAYVLCEVFLAEVEGARLRREWAEVDVAGMGRGRVPRLRFG